MALVCYLWNMINTDMLSHIAFGNQDYVVQLLESAKEEIQEIKSKVREKGQHKELIWQEMHKLKTTLSMLRAGDHVRECQSIMDHMEINSDETLSKQLSDFMTSLNDVENAVTAAIGTK